MPRDAAARTIASYGAHNPTAYAAGLLAWNPAGMVCEA